MTTANDNAAPLPTPAEFSTLLGELVTKLLVLEPYFNNIDAVDIEARRILLLESYERAYGMREPPRP